MNIKLTKKELKALAKEAKQNGFQVYINLSIASEEDLKQYLVAYDEWLSKAQEREERDKELKQLEELAVKEEAENQEQHRKQVVAFVEQKLANALPLSEVGSLVTKYLSQVKGYEANTWSKNAEMRIYLKDVSYTNPKDAGYIRITPEAEIRTNFIRSISNELESAIASLKQIIKVSVNDLVVSPRNRTPDEVKAAIASGENVSHSEICKALDALYGSGQWDDRDREDFEG